MIAGGTKIKIREENAHRFMWLAVLAGTKTCREALPIAKRGSAECPKDMDSYLRTLSCRKLSDVFKSNLALAIREKEQIAYDFGFRIRAQMTPNAVCRLFDQAIRYKKTTAAMGTIDVSGARPAPVRVSPRSAAHVNLERAEMTERQRELLGEAFLKAVRAEYGAQADVASAAKTLRDANFHWEGSGTAGYVVVIDSFKTRLTREIASVVRRNLRVFKGMFPRGRITSKHAAKVYNALVYPPTASTDPTPAEPTEPSTPSAPTGVPSGTGAAHQGSGQGGGDMTQAIKAKVHQGWDDKCVGHGRTETLAELSGAARQEAARICNMTDQSQRDAYFRRTPYNQLPSWLRLSIQNSRVNGAQYARAFGSGGATPPPSGSSPAPSDDASDGTQPAAPVTVPPAKKGKQRPVHSGVIVSKRRVDVGVQGALGKQDSGSDRPYSTQPSDGWLNKSKGFEYGFKIMALPLVFAKRHSVGAVFDYSRGTHKDIKLDSGEKIDGGSFWQWSIRAAYEYGLPHGFAIGGTLGVGQTKLEKSLFGKGGSELDQKSIDVVGSADVKWRKTLWSTKSVDVALVAEAGFKFLYGLSKVFKKGFVGEDDQKTHVKNRGAKVTGTVGISVGW